MTAYPKLNQVGNPKVRGIQTKRNIKYNEVLKRIYKEKGIEECEVKGKKCWKNNALTFAHRHKRRWYKKRQSLLSSFNQTILACTPCHIEIEGDKDKTIVIFVELRGLE